MEQHCLHSNLTLPSISSGFINITLKYCVPAHNLKMIIMILLSLEVIVKHIKITITQKSQLSSWTWNSQVKFCDTVVTLIIFLIIFFMIFQSTWGTIQRDLFPAQVEKNAPLPPKTQPMSEENRNLNKSSWIPTTNNNTNFIGLLAESVYFGALPLALPTIPLPCDEYTRLPHPSCIQCVPLHLTLTGLGCVSAEAGLKDADCLPLPCRLLDEG